MLNKFLGFSLGIVFFSCSGKLERYDERDSPTSGKLYLFCEEGLLLQMKNQAYTFESFYPNAKVFIHDKTEKDAIEGLFNDSCKSIVVNRDLSTEEKKTFSAANIHVVSHFISKNAVAIVSGLNFTDSLIFLPKLIKLLSGNDSTSDTNNNAKSLKIVFDKSNSGNIHYVKDSLLAGNSIGKNCFAAENMPQLIDWVSTSDNMLGIVDYAWLSDKDDPRTREILSKVKLIPVAKDENHSAFYPDQSNIATGDYPMVRNIYFIRRGADFSLGAGFLSFVAGPKGQLMFLKSGLVPARQQERKIEIKLEE